MKALRAFSRRLVGSFGRDRHDADLREELDSLAALQLDEQIAAGVPPDQARRDMLARRGSVTAVEAISPEGCSAKAAEFFAPWADSIARIAPWARDAIERTNR